MDIVGIEYESFDSFKMKIEQTASLVPKESITILPIKQEWIEDRNSPILQIYLSADFNTFGKAINFRFRLSERKSTTEFPK